MGPRLLCRVIGPADQRGRRRLQASGQKGFLQYRRGLRTVMSERGLCPMGPTLTGLRYLSPPVNALGHHTD